MKNIIPCFIMLLGSISLFGQWDVFPSHVAFRIADGTFDEWTHYTPFDISFWTDTNYDEGVRMQPADLTFFDMSTAGKLNKNSLTFTDLFGDRVRLDYTGLNVVNGASWTSFDLNVYGNGGQLDMYDGTSGSYLARLGSTSMNSGQGSLSIYSNMGQKSLVLESLSGGLGYLQTYGNNGLANTYVGATSSNYGYVYVADAAGAIQAYLYSNAGDSGKGYVVADVKNFKVPHPEMDDVDIWYACVEGPEAGAYDRGTSKLVSGEAFIPYSSHYSLISNPKTTTVQLTPHHWDTFGLAVIEKTDEGFRVKELKGGTGNFSFDWEVKSVRRGKENYEVLRPKNYIEAATNPNVEDNYDDPNQKKIVAKKSELTPAHKHSPNCVHSKKK